MNNILTIDPTLHPSERALQVIAQARRFKGAPAASVPKVEIAPSKISFTSVDCSGLDFSGTELDGLEFIECSFDNCDFSDAALSDTSFVNSTAHRANFSRASFRGLRLNNFGAHESTWRGASIYSRNDLWSWWSVAVTRSDFTDVELERGRLYRVSFTGSDLTGSRIGAPHTNMSVHDCRFDNVTARGAQFWIADDNSSTYSRSDFTGSTLVIVGAPNSVGRFPSSVMEGAIITSYVRDWAKEECLGVPRRVL